MLIFLAYTAFPYKSFDILAHTLPIEICFSTLDRFMISRVARLWIRVNESQQLVLEWGVLNDPNAAFAQKQTLLQRKIFGPLTSNLKSMQ
jgi:hypothetical protein